MNIEGIFLDKIWSIFNQSMPEAQLMLSTDEQDKVENILEEYHKAKLKNKINLLETIIKNGLNEKDLDNDCT